MSTKRLLTPRTLLKGLTAYNPQISLCFLLPLVGKRDRRVWRVLETSPRAGINR
mgnify:CR=1 FL=1